MRMAPGVLPSSLVDLVAAVPPVWTAEFDSLCEAASANPSEVSIFEYLARWAGVLEVEDYDTAAVAMREIGPADVIPELVAVSGLEPAADLDPTEVVVDLEARLAAELWPRYGFHWPSDAVVVEREREMSRMAALCLRGGPLHGRFWHWMDRFYYEVYRPWRTTRVDKIASFEQVAIEGLGSPRGTRPPQLGWLPVDTPLLIMPTVGAAAEAGEFDVVFWAEPFGLSSALAVAPGMFLTSFADHGVDFELSEAVRGELAMKLKALADPTRLSLLRMIRNMDVDNTQLAGFLEVSRPTVSVHAKLLAAAGFIESRQEGRQARHSFRPAALRQLCDELLRYLDVPEITADE
jgi:DNA-binding transcriptional ArsR family regulator